VKKKVDRVAPARDLYISALFLGRRAAVEDRADRWFILSAEHGLLEPDQRIAPYERSLATVSADERRQWASEILASLRAKLGDFGDCTFEIHAGRNYFDYGLRDGLRGAGAHVVVPTEGLAQGQQLQYYARHIRDGSGNRSEFMGALPEEEARRLKGHGEANGLRWRTSGRR
jgi:hypothetical protein